MNYIDRALEIVEDDISLATEMLISCLKYMGQDEVKEMLELNGYSSISIFNQDDYQEPSELDEWNSYDPEC